MTTVSLTYEELACRLGITTASVQRMAKRRRWRKTPGNDGRARVHVPEEYLAEREAARGASPVAPPRTPPVAAPGASPVVDPGTSPVATPGADPRARLAELQAELVEMARRAGAAEAVVEEMRQDRDRWHAQADKLSGEVADLARQLAKVVEEATAREREHQVRLMDVERTAVEIAHARADAEKQAAIAEATAAIKVEAEAKLAATQEQHLAELTAVRNQMQAALERTEQERDRLAGEVSRWVGLPWWRRLFA